MRNEIGGISRRDFVDMTGGALAASALGLGLGKSRAEAKASGVVDIGALEKALGRKVVTPATPDDYDARRPIWNALYDRRPAIIAQCQSGREVALCIGFARRHGLTPSIRSGGHHVAGFSMTDGGMVIDLSEMNDIKIDRKTRRVTAGPGARVGELCAATEAVGLVVPTAACSTVGIGGMTTGGGEGWFGEYGLTADCLLSAEVVTADGRILHVDKTHNPDLFWAIRGGGGNFGVVTALEFQAFPLTELHVGFLAYPLPLATQAGIKWRDHVATAPPHMSGGCAFVRTPVPAMMTIAKFGCPKAEAEAAFQTLRALTPPVQASMKPVTLTELQMLNDLGNELGGRYYAYSHYLKELPAAVFDIARAAIESAPSAYANIVLLRQNPGISARPVDATAYPHRGARFSLLVQSRWDDGADDLKNIQWVKDCWQKILPFATGEIYSNYVGETNADVAARAYGPNYGRLAQIKRRYDPDNVFSTGINITPA